MKRHVVSLGLLAFSCCVCAEAPAQNPHSAYSVAATRKSLTALRDDFVAGAMKSGLPCAIKPPRIVVHDVPSYGSYDPDDNTLTSPAWSQLSAEEQSLFYRALGPKAKAEDARAEFELGVHHWVIVHELGHWWEACRGVVDHGDHYDFELQADNIAAAYWNEKDPAVITHQRQVFQAIVANWPNPVPAGDKAETYFNRNYEALAPTRDYIWFQAQMCIRAFTPDPLPDFSSALVRLRPNQPP